MAMRHVQQDDAVDAEAEQHGGGARRGGRQPLIRKPQPAEHDDQRQRRGQRSDRDQPHASEGDVEQRQNQRQRADRVENGLAAHDGLGFDGNAVAAGELDPERRQRLFVRLSRGARGAAADRRVDLAQPRVERARERRVVRRTARPGDDETAVAVFGHVSRRR